MSYAEQVAALAPQDAVQFDGRRSGASADETLRTAAEGVSGNGGTLPHAEKIQQSFGQHSIGAVQAHIGGPASDASRRLGAEAYATGEKVAFGASPSLHTAAHEAAHVVQQRSGVSLKGGVGAVGDRYEQHADAVADLVVQGKSAEGLLGSDAGGRAGGAPVRLRASTDGAVQFDGAGNTSDVGRTASELKIDGASGAPGAADRELLRREASEIDLISMTRTEISLAYTDFQSACANVKAELKAAAEKDGAFWAAIGEIALGKTFPALGRTISATAADFPASASKLRYLVGVLAVDDAKVTSFLTAANSAGRAAITSYRPTPTDLRDDDSFITALQTHARSAFSQVNASLRTNDVEQLIAVYGKYKLCDQAAYSAAIRDLVQAFKSQVMPIGDVTRSWANRSGAGHERKAVCWYQVGKQRYLARVKHVESAKLVSLNTPPPSMAWDVFESWVDETMIGLAESRYKKEFGADVPVLRVGALAVPPPRTPAGKADEKLAN